MRDGCLNGLQYILTVTLNGRQVADIRVLITIQDFNGTDQYQN